MAMRIAPKLIEIPGRVIGAIAMNATILNLGIVGLCFWFVGTKQDIPNLLLGALIANSGNTIGSLSSVLNSTRSNPDSVVNVEQAEQVGPQEGTPPAPAPAPPVGFGN